MKKSDERICLISSPSKKSIKKILKIMNGRRFKWVYFGEDISQAVLIEETIGERGERLEIAGLLQETAKKLRQPYIDYIGKISRRKNSLRWWTSSVSEKSPFNSKTFLHVCYIKTCVDILRIYPDCSFVFFVKNRTVRRALFKNLRVDNLEHIEDLGRSICDALKDLKEFVLYKAWFLLSSIYRTIIAKYACQMQKRIDPHKSYVVIHTWIDNRSFDEKWAYREIYFGKLPEYLKSNGKNVIIVPHVLSTVQYRKTINKIAKSGFVFLVPHAFLSIRDIINVFFITLANKPKKTNFPKFEDFDISEVIYEDLKNDWVQARVTFDLLIYHFVKHLREKHLLIDTMIYPYENQIWEKILCIAMRRLYPSAYLVGYQHSTISMMYLNYFFSKYESDILPLPDRIVTNGKYIKDVFCASNYPKKIVVKGGAVRYEYLLKSKGIKKRQKRDKPVVLVTPSINKFEAAELIWKVLKAFEQNDKYKIVIKCHPDMPFEIISKHLNIKLPGHFTVTNKPVAELLEESDVLLYTCSTTCVEAIAAGVPVIHVESDLMIDLDQLDFNPKLRPSARTPEEILNSVEKAISMNEKELSRKRKIWGKVVRNLFGEVNESTYRLFLRDPRQNFRIDSLKN
jgi:hypothetical protein